MAPGAGKRTDVASRVIEAPPGAIYRALTDAGGGGGLEGAGGHADAHPSL